MQNTTSVLILHGIGGHAGIHWQQWLHDELQTRGYQVIMPDLPETSHPDRQEWLEGVVQATHGVDTAKLIIVAHSLGVTTALDFIKESSTPIKELVGVSGFAIDYGSELNSYFLRERSIDLVKMRTKIGSVKLFYGDDDPYVIQGALRQLADGLGVGATVIHEGGHLNTERGYSTFPQVLEAVLA